MCVRRARVKKIAQKVLRSKYIQEMEDSCTKEIYNTYTFIIYMYIQSLRIEICVPFEKFYL